MQDFIDEKKLYHLKCGSQVFKFKLKTLTDYPKSLITQKLLERGQCQEVFLDYDESIMNIIIREMKHPGCLTWHELSDTQLKLIIEYSNNLGLRRIYDDAMDAYDAKQELIKSSFSAVESMAKILVKLSHEQANKELKQAGKHNNNHNDKDKDNSNGKDSKQQDTIKISKFLLEYIKYYCGNPQPEDNDDDVDIDKADVNDTEEIELKLNLETSKKNFKQK